VDYSHLPQSPARRDAQKGSMIELMIPQVPDGIIERMNEEGPASIIPTFIRPILFIFYKCRVTRSTTDAVFLCQFVARKVTHNGFEIMIGEPPRRIEDLLEHDELWVHLWMCEGILVVLVLSGTSGGLW